MNVFYHYVRRAYELGFFGTYTRLKVRTISACTAWYWKQRAHYKRINHSWSTIAQQHKLAFTSTFFLKTKHPHAFIQKLYQSEAFITSLPESYRNGELLGHFAQQHKACVISILGSPLCSFSPTSMPWHQDFRATLHPEYVHFPLWQQKSLQFYRTITIDTPQFNSLHSYAADIKIPWELSRLQHLTHLGFAYKIFKNESYAQVCATQLDDWIIKNPCLLGVNWVCPMDVGIRAINMIWSLYLFDQSKAFNDTLRERLICSLYDHAWYLERNWEKSDKSSNHYLSDLIGYLYLCFFFESLPYFAQQKEWCIQELLRESEQQLQQDGTSYEGSTSYHKLVTEIFLHFSLLCKTNDIALPEYFLQKFSKSLQFLSDCIDDAGRLIRIGDDDSGKIVTGLEMSVRPEAKSSRKIIHYPHFGLSVIHSQDWHISYRHPTFSSNQPSGHFHHDQLAITLTYKNIPILVDPGSYWYTAHPLWRNTMRSITHHSTFYLDQEEPPLGPYLFQLPRKEQADTALLMQTEENITIENWYESYHHTSLRAHRKLIFEPFKKQCSLTDRWSGIRPYTSSISIWHFLFHPALTLMNADQEGHAWEIYYQEKLVMRMYSTLTLEMKEGWYAPYYGSIQKTVRLIAHTSIQQEGSHFFDGV